jgi:hypothetical protein
VLASAFPLPARRFTQPYRVPLARAPSGSCVLASCSTQRSALTARRSRLRPTPFLRSARAHIARSHPLRENRGYTSAQAASNIGSQMAVNFDDHGPRALAGHACPTHCGGRMNCVRPRHRLPPTRRRIGEVCPNLSLQRPMTHFDRLTTPSQPARALCRHLSRRQHAAFTPSAPRLPSALCP